MRPIRIVADASIPYLSLGMPTQGVEVIYLPSQEITAQSVRDADALMIRSVTQCNRSLLHKSSIKLVTTATAGTDHIDADYCKQKGITWYNAPGCNAMGVVQYVLTALSFLAKKQNKPLKGQTIGIVGVGNVGGRLKLLAEAIGMKTLCVDPPRARKEGAASSFVSLNDLPQNCDIISLHTPLTHSGEDATYHLIEESFLSSCSHQKPLLINACRGAVTDTIALKKAIDRGWIRGAIIDCWEREPHIDTDLLQRTLLASPHIAGFSAEGKARGAAMSLEALGKFFDIDLPNLDQVCPQPPLNPHIDLTNHSEQWVIEEALLQTLNPLQSDQDLRNAPNRFELLRTDYFHQPEMSAYTIFGVSDYQARETLQAIGFHLS